MAAPHPAAARLWQEFIYSAEAQNLFIVGGAYPVTIQTLQDAGTVDTAALDALVAHAWPNNLDELFEQAPRLLACLMHPTLRRAAEALGVTRQTLTQHLDRLGVAVVSAAERRWGDR